LQDVQVILESSSISSIQHQQHPAPLLPTEQLLTSHARVQPRKLHCQLQHCSSYNTDHCHLISCCCSPGQEEGRGGEAEGAGGMWVEQQALHMLLYTPVGASITGSRLPLICDAVRWVNARCLQCLLWPSSSPRCHQVGSQRGHQWSRGFADARGLTAQENEAEAAWRKCRPHPWLLEMVALAQQPLRHGV
jgi:hypothetical protein